MKCAIKEAFFIEFFFFVFVFICYYIMTAIILLSINSEKRLQKSRKRLVLLLYSSKRCTGKKTYMRLISSSRVGNCLFLFARGLGIDFLACWGFSLHLHKKFCFTAHWSLAPQPTQRLALMFFKLKASKCFFGKIRPVCHKRFLLPGLRFPVRFP